MVEDTTNEIHSESESFSTVTIGTGEHTKYFDSSVVVFDENTLSCFFFVGFLLYFCEWMEFGGFLWNFYVFLVFFDSLVSFVDTFFGLFVDVELTVIVELFVMSASLCDMYSQYFSCSILYDLCLFCVTLLFT